MINKISGRACNSKELKYLNLDGEIVSNLDTLTNAVNQFFVDGPRNLTSHLTASNTHFTTNGSNSLHNNMFFLRPVSQREIIRQISSLKNGKSVGVDGLSSTVLKKIVYLIVEILTYLINSCFQVGVFPTCLKKAIVVPVFKKGDQLEISNYRPISLLSSFSKVFERCLKDRILDFLGHNNTLAENQFGFRPGRNSETALLLVMESVYESINMNLCTAVVFLDLKKAFDTVNHSLLLETLNSVGFGGHVLDLLRSYLSNRSQSVRIKNVFSADLQINCGVPQGSVLGPILFLIYINELCGMTLKGKLVAYADDISIVYSENSWDIVHESIEHDLGILRRWLDHFHMILSDKSSIMRFVPSSLLGLPDHVICHSSTCSGQSCDTACIRLNFVEQLRYLGVILDSKLTWTAHADMLKSSLIPTIRGCYELSKYCSERLLRSFYFACIDSRLNYALNVWGGHSEISMHPVYMSQRFALRALLGKKKRDSLRLTFMNWRVFPLQYMFKYKTLRVFFMRGGLRCRARERSDRHGLMAVVPRPRCERFKRSFSFSAPSLFNTLPRNIREATRRSEFLDGVLSWLWQSYRYEFLEHIA